MVWCLLLSLPFCMTVLIYARMLAIANRHRKLFRKFRIETTSTRANQHRRKNRKALTTFLLVTIVSCFTWLPAAIVVITGQFSHHVLVDCVVHAFACCNQWINILIYTIRDQSFRNTAVTILNRCKERKERLCSKPSG